MIRVAIAGGTGYTSGELLRILLNHPKVEVVSVLSSSLAGESVASVHRDLLGDTDLKFSASLCDGSVKVVPDVLFLTLGHGLSAAYMDKLGLPAGCKVIDLGNDFRLGDKYNGNSFVYGLCEANRESIKNASFIANPGCFATAILLALMPLAKEGMLNKEIHVNAVTGSTGAGKSLSESTHFSYRSSNFSAYKPFAHQHLSEIKLMLSEGGSLEYGVPEINFIPFRGGFTRGIFASIYTKMPDAVDLEKVEGLYISYYSSSPFVKVSPFPLSVKEVVNTNKALVHLEFHNGYLYITSVIDNLLKGASGQAVQNMNIMFGLEEFCGLKLKGSAF